MPESEELRSLRLAHREALKQRGEIATLDELLKIVLTIPEGREAYLRAITEQIRAHAEALSNKDEDIRFLRAQLELQTQLTRSPESVRPPLRMPKHGHCSRGKLSVNLAMLSTRLATTAKPSSPTDRPSP